MSMIAPDPMSLNRPSSNPITADRIRVVLDPAQVESGHESRFDVLAGLLEAGISVTRAGEGAVAPLDKSEDLMVLRQTLWNLLSNAVKFTNAGYVSLKIEKFKNGRSGADWLRIVVEDTGIGIEKSRQEAVFEDFVQEDDSTTREFGGAGLGLAIVRRLVSAADGKIDLQSEKGEGALFVIELPLGL